jgi:hypothetical protein
MPILIENPKNDYVFEKNTVTGESNRKISKSVFGIPKNTETIFIPSLPSIRLFGLKQTTARGTGSLISSHMDGFAHTLVPGMCRASQQPEFDLATHFRILSSSEKTRGVNKIYTVDLIIYSTYFLLDMYLM